MNSCISQITMTTVWLLLLLVVVASSQSVDSQSDQSCSCTELRELKRDMTAVLENQRIIMEHQHIVMSRLGTF